VKTCDCIDKIDKLLVERHTEIVTPLTLNGEPLRTVVATTLTVNAPRRARPVVMVASYCPLGGALPAFRNHDGSAEGLSDVLPRSEAVVV